MSIVSDTKHCDDTASECSFVRRQLLRHARREQLEVLGAKMKCGMAVNSTVVRNPRSPGCGITTAPSVNPDLRWAFGSPVLEEFAWASHDTRWSPTRVTRV
jgi:hypothetical protein